MKKNLYLATLVTLCAISYTNIVQTYQKFQGERIAAYMTFQNNTGKIVYVNLEYKQPSHTHKQAKNVEINIGETKTIPWTYNPDKGTISLTQLPVNKDHVVQSIPKETIYKSIKCPYQNKKRNVYLGKENRYTISLDENEALIVTENKNI